MIRTLAAAGIILSLTGCTQFAEILNLPKQSPEQQLQNACDTFSETLDVIDPNRLSDANEERVTATVALVKPVCGQRQDLNQTGVTLTTALAVIAQGTANLAAINQGRPTDGQS